MATSDILQLAGTTTAFTATGINSLASSTAGVGIQTNLVTRANPGPGGAHMAVKFKLGTSPTANKAVYVYRIDGDGTIRTDGAGTSSGAWTRKSAKLLGVLYTGSAPATGDVLQGVFYMANVGKEFGLGIVHDTGVNSDSTAGNFTVEYTLDNPEAQ